uniref:Putative secreted protein n=1 Tax=Anopheles darlingi TaxID=43151 RepID=A0A2M4DFE6_ANODA
MLIELWLVADLLFPFTLLQSSSSWLPKLLYRMMGCTDSAAKRDQAMATYHAIHCFLPRTPIGMLQSIVRGAARRLPDTPHDPEVINQKERAPRPFAYSTFGFGCMSGGQAGHALPLIGKMAPCSASYRTQRMAESRISRHRGDRVYLYTLHFSIYTRCCGCVVANGACVGPGPSGIGTHCKISRIRILLFGEQLNPNSPVYSLFGQEQKIFPTERVTYKRSRS